LLATTGQNLGDGHQDGRVAVVATGVHDAHLASFKLGRGTGGKGQIHGFRDRQGIHVSAQGQHRAGLPPLEQSHDTGMRYAGLYFQSQGFQMMRHQCGGAEFAVGQFRMAMQVAPPVDELIAQLFAVLVDVVMQLMKGKFHKYNNSCIRRLNHYNLRYDHSNCTAGNGIDGGPHGAAHPCVRF